MNYPFLFSFLKYFGFWIKFDTVDSINTKIPEDKENLLDFCPICSISLGSKLTRIHKIHDLKVHPQSPKEKCQELLRGILITYSLIFLVFVIGFAIFAVVGIVLSEFIFVESTDELPADVKNFIDSCNFVNSIYNDTLRNSTLTHSLLDEINLGYGICNDGLRVAFPSSEDLVQRYYNMTNSTSFR